jgi:two-component system, cell cycle sensor histidine kinase and response regulator CckA
MANSRNLAVNAAILLAASATASVAAPPNVAAVPQSPWLIGALLVLAFIAGACGWLLWDTRRRLRLAVQQPPLPPQDALSAAIVRDSSDAIFTLDAAGLVQSMNPAAAKQFGYSLEEIRGKNISTLIPPPARGRQRANYMTNPGMRELFGVRRDGSRFPVDVKLDELTFANWNLMGLSVRDISTRHASEKDLEQRLASAEAIVNQTGALVFVLSRDGVIERMNRACEALLDFSGGEVRGQALWEIVAMPARMEELREQMEQFLRGPFPARAELVFAARDGHEYTLSCVFTATLDELSTIESIILTAHDISARKAFERTHVRTERMAAVSRLAGGVAHDFNNLLTAITGYSGLALQNLESENPLRKDLEEIKRAGDRGAAITRQLLAVSGRHPRRPRLVNLNESLKSAERMLRVLTGEPVQLELHPDPKLPPVEADVAQVEEVILHLAAFLREQMPQGGRLAIRTATEQVAEGNPDAEPPLGAGTYVVLTLSDTSRGLSPEAIAHLFEPFFPAQETSRSNGLGLAMVAGLIKQNGGAILVNATAGGGNQVRVYWPKAAQPEFLTPDRPTPLFVVPKTVVTDGTETVLVAMERDDERSRIKAMLEPAGYMVLEARSGLQAMEISHKHGDIIHLLVTDIVLPRMSGADLALGIRVARPAVRTLYVTSRSTAEILAQGLSPASVVALNAETDAKDVLVRLRAVLDTKTMSVGQ